MDKQLLLDEYQANLRAQLEQARLGLGWLPDLPGTKVEIGLFGDLRLATPRSWLEPTLEALKGTGWWGLLGLEPISAEGYDLYFRYYEGWVGTLYIAVAHDDS